MKVATRLISLALSVEVQLMLTDRGTPEWGLLPPGPFQVFTHNSLATTEDS